jgi:hypothetical protein
MQSFQKIYNNLENTSSIEKKILIREIYYKYVIRTNKDIYKSELSATIDNFFSYEKTALLPESYLKKKNFVGYSLHIKKEKFIAKYMHNMHLELPYLSQKRILANSTKSLQEAVAITNKIKGVPAVFILYAVIRGAFRVYSASGALGILPFRQFRLSLLPIFGFKRINLANFLNFIYFSPSPSVYPFFWMCGSLTKIRLVKFKPIGSKIKKPLTRPNINRLMNPFIQNEISTPLIASTQYLFFYKKFSRVIVKKKRILKKNKC